MVNTRMEIVDNKVNRSPWPYAILASFLALAIFDAGIVVLALKHPSQPIQEDSYEAGQKYQEVIDAREEAKRDHVNAIIDVSHRMFQVQVTGLRPGTPWEMSVELLRPNDTSLDIRKVIASTEATVYYESPTIEPGLWLTRVRVTGPGKSYELHSGIVDVTN